MQLLKLGTLLSFFFYVAGCATGSPIISSLKTISFPETNEVASQELGDTLVSYIESSTTPSFRIVRKLDWQNTFPNHRFGGHPVEKIQINTVLTPANETDRFIAFREGLLCYEKDKDILCAGQSGVGACSCSLGAKSWDNTYFEPADYVDVRQPNLRMELIYNGKIDNSVKFLYREISGGYMRDAFSQEIQYDLGEGNEIGFKGARILIHNATNRTIEYEVLQHFKLIN